MRARNILQSWPFRPFTYVFMTTLLYIVPEYNTVSNVAHDKKRNNAFPLLQLRLKRHPLHLESCNGAGNYRRFYWCTHCKWTFYKRVFFSLSSTFFRWLMVCLCIFHDWKAGESRRNWPELRLQFQERFILFYLLENKIKSYPIVEEETFAWRPSTKHPTNKFSLINIDAGDVGNEEYHACIFNKRNVFNNDILTFG